MSNWDYEYGRRAKCNNLYGVTKVMEPPEMGATAVKLLDTSRAPELTIILHKDN